MVKPIQFINLLLLAALWLVGAQATAQTAGASTQNPAATPSQAPSTPEALNARPVAKIVYKDDDCGCGVDIAKVKAAQEKLKAVAVPSAPTAPTTPAPAATPTTAPAPTSAAGKSPETLYKTYCIACHQIGVANAPKLGDKAAWAPRVATGVPAMLQSVVKGKNAMPPRAGTTLTDDELRSVVEWMSHQ